MPGSQFADSSMGKLFSADTRHKLAKYYAYDLQLSLNSCIKFLSPDNHSAYPLEPEIFTQPISFLCLSFCVNPKTSVFVRVSKQVLSWIPWICKKATKCSFSFDVYYYISKHFRLYCFSDPLILEALNYLKMKLVLLATVVKILVIQHMLISSVC